MDIAGSLLKMTDVEIGADQPLTEALMTKIGANINGLIDLGGQYELIYASAGFVVPENISRIYTLVVSGGGGGGSGGRQGLGTGAGGGGGSVLPVFGMLLVTPGETLTVTVGAGGAGGPQQGSSGLPGTIGTVGGTSSIYRSSTKLLEVLGGSPGNAGTATPGAGAVGGWSVLAERVGAGAGGSAAIGVAGGASFYGVGGAAGARGTINGGGGGGAAGFCCAGGAGGQGSISGLFATVGQGGTGSGAGGGGGGAGSTISGEGGAAGGAGHAGFVLISW